MDLKKYLVRLVNAIRSENFNEAKYRGMAYWHGIKIATTPLFASYGTIGFTATVYSDEGQFDISCDMELGEITIDDVPWREYINTMILAEHEISVNYSDDTPTLELSTPEGEDMNIDLKKVKKKYLQEYIDNFDINEEVLIWWRNGVDAAKKNGVPFDNIRDHYNDYEKYIKNLQRICNKLYY